MRGLVNYLTENCCAGVDPACAPPKRTSPASRTKTKERT
jgi:hypothetical protein